MIIENSQISSNGTTTSKKHKSHISRAPKSAFVLLGANLLLCIKNIKFYFILFFYFKLFFYLFIDCFDIILILKINFKKIKNIILIHFHIKIF